MRRKDIILELAVGRSLAQARARVFSTRQAMSDVFILSYL